MKALDDMEKALRMVEQQRMKQAQKKPSQED